MKNSVTFGLTWVWGLYLRKDEKSTRVHAPSRILPPPQPVCCEIDDEVTVQELSAGTVCASGLVHRVSH